MTLQQSLQTDASRTKELFDRLEATSDQAVKTREALLADLGRELRLHLELEQRHLIPALRGNERTKALVPDAVKANDALAAQLDELEALPKDDPSFRQHLAGLRKLFQQQARAERQALVPAAEKKLGKQRTEALAGRIDAVRAEAEAEQRAEDAARKQAATRENETREARAAAKQAATEVVDATRDNARDLGKSAVESARRGIESVQRTSESAVAGAERAVRRVSEEVGETVATYRETVRERGQDLKAVATGLRSFARVGAELRALAWNGLRQSGRDGFQASAQLLRNPLSLAKVQRDYVKAASRNVLESTRQALQIVRSASTAARQPIERRLEAVS